MADSDEEKGTGNVAVVAIVVIISLVVIAFFIFLGTRDQTEDVQIMIPPREEVYIPEPSPEVTVPENIEVDVNDQAGVRTSE